MRRLPAQPVEIEVRDRRRIEREELAHDQAAEHRLRCGRLVDGRLEHVERLWPERLERMLPSGDEEEWEYAALTEAFEAAAGAPVSIGEARVAIRRGGSSQETEMRTIWSTILATWALFAVLADSACSRDLISPRDGGVVALLLMSDGQVSPLT